MFNSIIHLCSISRPVRKPFSVLLWEPVQTGLTGWTGWDNYKFIRKTTVCCSQPMRLMCCMGLQLGCSTSHIYMRRQAQSHSGNSPRAILFHTSLIHMHTQEHPLGHLVSYLAHAHRLDHLVLYLALDLKYTALQFGLGLCCSMFCLWSILHILVSTQFGTKK